MGHNPSRFCGRKPWDGEVGGLTEPLNESATALLEVLSTWTPAAATVRMRVIAHGRFEITHI